MKLVDFEVEQKLLATVLLNQEVWHSVQTRFNPKLFALEEYNKIATLITRVSESGKTPSVTSIARLARKEGINAEELLRLSETLVIKSEAPDLIHILTDLHKKRTTLTKLKEAVYTIENGDKPTNEIIAIAQDALLSAFNEDRKEVLNWSDVLGQVYEEQLLAQEGRLDEAIPLGLDFLQDKIGGLIKKHQIILAARPSMGKSALAMNIIKAVIKKSRRAILFTPEQANQEFAQRSLAAELSIPADLFGGKMDPHYMDKLNTGLSNVQGWPLRLYDKPKPTIEQIKQICRAEKARYPDLDLMVIDYLGECDLQENKYGGMHQATGRAVSELRALAKELNIAQLVLAQLSRNLETRTDKRPIMADLRESGRIEEVADMILFLYREGYYSEGFLGSEYGDNICEINIAKKRKGSGAGNRIFVYFNRDYLRFERLDPQWGQKYTAFLQAKKGKGA